MDRNGDGRVDRSELKRLLSKFRIDLTSGELDGLFERFDGDRSGSFEYMEFLDLIGAHPSDARLINSKLRDDTDSILNTLRRKLEDYLGPGANAPKRLFHKTDDTWTMVTDVPNNI